MIRIAGTFKVAVLFYDSKTGGKGGSDRVVARGVFFFFYFLRTSEPIMRGSWPLAPNNGTQLRTILGEHFYHCVCPETKRSE